MKKPRISSIAAFKIPIIVGFLVYAWFTQSFGPQQALAFKAGSALIALSIWFSYARLINVLNRLNTHEWFPGLPQSEQVKVHCCRLIVAGLIVAACFIG